MKNVNYHLSQKDLVSDQDCDQVSEQDKSQDILHAVLDFCITEKSKQEICSFIGYRNLTYFTRKYLNPLLASGSPIGLIKNAIELLTKISEYQRKE